MNIEIADYDHERDFKAVDRIYREVGWLEKDDTKVHEELARAVYEGVVFRLDGEAECLATTSLGAMRHLETDLDLAVVTGVTTSRVARKLGAAKRVTATAIAQRAEAGSEIASLGMFEQGFYDRLGFGSGAYSRTVTFDPATLKVDRRFRPPKRLTKDHWRDVHDAMHQRLRGHGGCVLDTPEIIRGELGFSRNPIGLGYYDGGSLTHFIWGGTDGEHGPYRIWWYAYRTPEQLLELLALIRSLGDQVAVVSMEEPPEVQFQDVLEAPFRNRRVTEGSKYAGSHRTDAWWQARMLDVPKCFAKTHLETDDVSFNLELTDPIAEHMEEGSRWRGVAGDYVVTLGQYSAARAGRDAALPTLRASVGAFTRIWLGVRSPSVLARTDDLDAEPALLNDLDRALQLPQPHVGWDY